MIHRCFQSVGMTQSHADTYPYCSHTNHFNSNKKLKGPLVEVGYAAI